MKVKFVKVWDDLKFGYVKHIILQVEESDTFLTEENFNPGYKFIISAVYHGVGAAGGHDFNPYHGNRVRDISQKIDYTESDVLGFYLQKVKNIYDIPEELHTNSFWDVVRTDGYGDRDKELYENNDMYYKVLHTSIYDLKELYTKLLDMQNEKGGLLKEKGIDLEAIINEHEKWDERLNIIYKKTGNNSETRKSIKFAIINKESLVIVNDKWSTSNDGIIADYLWCPYEELPDYLWGKVQEKNEISLDRIYKLNEDAEVK